MEIKEINRGNGITELRMVPDGDPMEVKRIHIRRKKQANDIAEITFLVGMVMTIMGLLFGTILVQFEAVYVLYWIVSMSLVAFSAHVSGIRRATKKTTAVGKQ